jgi:hypothetical protein
MVPSSRCNPFAIVGRVFKAPPRDIKATFRRIPACVIDCGQEQIGQWPQKAAIGLCSPILNPHAKIARG